MFYVYAFALMAVLFAGYAIEDHYARKNAEAFWDEIEYLVEEAKN